MGRQIGIWAIQEDYKELYEVLLSNNIIVLTHSGNRIDPSNKKFYTIFGASQCYLTKEGFNLKYKPDNTFDPWNSEVIEFIYCRPNKLKITDSNGCEIIRTGYEHGRLWYDPNFYDENFSKIPKCKELTSMYELLKRYIRKNYRISTHKFGYIAPHAYEEYLKGNYIPCSGNYRFEF